MASSHKLIRDEQYCACAILLAETIDKPGEYAIVG